ncbi:MAG: hypothetical protein CL917_06460 [Deltaproteobacteria bacterium]|nr:hypothetical protein [Deltaproteobacteria bacterium]
MMILVIYSPCYIEGSNLWIDRKVHSGNCLFAQQLSIKITMIAPVLEDPSKMMDLIAVPLDELTYAVEPLKCDDSYVLDSSETERVRKLVQKSTLVYGTGFEIHTHTQKLNKAHVAIAEFNLATQIQISRLAVEGTLRRSARTAKTLLRFLGESRMHRHAHSVHCNGYPMYYQTKYLNDNCLLYLDSRMTENLIINLDRLEARLEDFAKGRKARLIYSGRYEAIKGALDVVEVGIELNRRGVRFELDLFGKGAQAEEMRRRVETSGGGDNIRVNDAIPYPELIERSHDSDLFVCCHVQDDPSCTYLEASGSGLPIAGYNNRMWKNFARFANNGVITTRKQPKDLANKIEKLLSDRQRLIDFSRQSREFALAHTFEKEFGSRIKALQAIRT